MVSKLRKRVTKVEVKKNNDVTLMVDFTAQQLYLCYQRLALYPELQEDILKLISKLKKLL